MPTLRDFCVALLAGTVSVPSTYVVVKKTTAQKTVEKPAPKTVSKRNPAPARTVAVKTPAPEKPCIVDMPSIGVQPDLQLVDVVDLQPKLRPWWDSGPWVSGPWFPPGGGGGGSVSPPSAIPQPDTWVMMVAGFGFLGLSLRRKRRKEA